MQKQSDKAYMEHARFRWETTKDGSRTLFDSQSGEAYKSRHAARAESESIYWRHGVSENPLAKDAFSVLELGFGLGSNLHFLLESWPKTFIHRFDYLGIDRDLSGARFFWQEENDPYGLSAFVETLSGKNTYFEGTLLEEDFLSALAKQKNDSFSTIFFAPFPPKANPESWSQAIFQECFRVLKPKGRLLTYSVSRVAKDCALSAGFRIEKIPLPEILQKRHGLLAIKD